MGTFRAQAKSPAQGHAACEKPSKLLSTYFFKCRYNQYAIKFTFLFFKLFLKILFIYLEEEGEKRGRKESQVDLELIVEPDMGLHPMTLRS